MDLSKKTFHAGFPRGVFSFAALILFMIVFPACAQVDEPLVVGVTESPPFSFKEDGEWRGLSVDIWKNVSEKMQVEYEIRPFTVNELLEAIRQGKADIAAAALFTTAERERFMNFTHSFYSGGLGIATKAEHGSPRRVFLNLLTRGGFFRLVFMLGAVLFVVGLIIWMAERKVNPDHFPRNPVRGIGSGFWFSAVTMTTVGYGDKAPASFLGKLVGLIWMFASIVLISTFTGAVASVLTISTLSPVIESFDDLYNAKVGTVAGSWAAEYLREQGISFQEFSDTVSGLEALRDDLIEGFINDEVLLRYIVRKGFPGELVVLDRAFETGFYALGINKDSPLRDEINLHLLEYIQGQEWQGAVRRYIGN